MGIIMAIRKFLRLDKTIIELDSNIIDNAGLIIAERKDFMILKNDGCFGQDIIYFNHFTGDSYHSNDGYCYQHQP
jgi:hypothetical protein